MTDRPDSREALVHMRIDADLKARWVRHSRAAGQRLTDWIIEKVEFTMPITYIWRAEQSEPGMSGVRYTVTAAPEAPAALEPMQAQPGLVYGESLYGDWELVGTAKGACYTNDYGAFIELDAPENAGSPIEVEDVVRLGWYSRAQSVPV